MSMTWNTDTDDFQEALQEWRESSTDRATISVEAIAPRELSRILQRAQELKQQRRTPGRYAIFA